MRLRALVLAGALVSIGIGGSSARATNVGGAINTNTTWTAAGNPYNVTSSITVGSGATLTIQAGVQVKVGLNMGITVSSGRILAQGTSGNQVLFTTSVTPVVAGHWRSLTISSATQTSELSHVRIEGAGRTSLTSLIVSAPTATLDHVSVGVRGAAGVQFTNTDATFSNGTVEAGPGVGISIQSGAPQISSSNISASTTHRGVVVTQATSGLSITGSTIAHGAQVTFADASLVVSGNTFANYATGLGLQLLPQHVSQVLGSNTLQGATGSSVINVNAGSITSTAVWPKYVYAAAGSITSVTGASGSWTIEAGAEIRMPVANSSVTISSGALLVVGTVTEPVLFTSAGASKAPGDWYGVVLAAAAQPSEIRYARIEYAGRSNLPSLDLDVNSGTFDHITVASRAAAGVRLSTTSAVLQDSTVEPGPAAAVLIAGGGPTIDGCTLASSTGVRAIDMQSATSGLQITDSTIHHGADLDVSDSSIVVTGNTFADYTVGLGLRLYADHVAQVMTQNVIQGAVPGVSAVTVPAGSILSTGTWPKFVYALTGNLTFAGAATEIWTVAAGADFRIPTNVGVTVNTGSLRALGTASEPVRFTSDVQPAVAGRWTGITLGGYGQPSTLQHVRIEGAGALNTNSLSVSTETVEMDHVSIGVRAAIGLQLTSVAEGTLLNGTIEAGPAVGLSTNSNTVTLDGWNIASTSPALAVNVQTAPGFLTILDSTLTGGVKTAGPLTLRRSTVQNSAGIGLECTGTGGGVRVSDSQFTNNATVGISCARALEITRNTITGSPVGIRLTNVEPRLRLRNNNLAGLTTPLQNQDTDTGVDARLNWWGTTSNPASLVSGSALTNPWLGSAFAGPFEVQEAVTSPASFVPISNSTTFGAVFSESGSWAIQVSDPGLTPVRSFSGSSAGIAQNWAGDDPNGVALPNATYSYTLNATGASGAAAPVIGEIALNSALLTARLTSPVSLDYRLNAPIAVQGVVAGAGLTSWALSYAPGAAPLDSQFLQVLGGSGTAPVSGSIASLNASNLLAGVYTLRLQANAGAAPPARHDIVVKIVRAIGTATTYFSPNADGQLEESVLAGTLTIDTPWVIQVVDAASQTQLQYTGELSDLDAVWDGRNGIGALQPDGIYSYKISLPAAPGLGVLQLDTTVLDTTPPTAQIDTPLTGATFLGYDDIPFVGTANDLNMRFYTMTAAPASNPTNDTSFVLNSTTEIISSTLGVLDLGDGIAPDFPNGGVIVNMEVEDWARNKSYASRTFDLDMLRISAVSGSPEAIDPVQSQSATIAFTLDRAADVSLQMYQRGTHALIRTLLDEEPLSAGASSFFWDGRNGGGQIVAPGSYYFSIQADDGAGRTAVYNDPADPTLGQGYAATNWKVNGIPAAQLSTVDFQSFQNDQLLITFTGNGRGTSSVWIHPQQPTLPYIVLRTYAPHVTGENYVYWDGRGNDGKPLKQPFEILGINGMGLELHSIVVRYPLEFVNARTNPYLFHPAHAQVTNLRYTLNGPADVAVDVIDPDGNFLATLQPSTAQAAGDYQLIWDGKNPAGEFVTTEGSYTLRLTGVDDASGQSFSRNATVMVSD